MDSGSPIDPGARAECISPSDRETGGLDAEAECVMRRISLAHDLDAQPFGEGGRARVS
jgi:hypothetical protein